MEGKERRGRRPRRQMPRGGPGGGRAARAPSRAVKMKKERDALVCAQASLSSQTARYRVVPSPLRPSNTAQPPRSTPRTHKKGPASPPAGRAPPPGEELSPLLFRTDKICERGGMRAPRRRAALAARTTLPLLLLLSARSLTPARAADVIASSKLEACVADGGSSAAASSPPPLACSQKLVLAVAVDASDAASASSSRVELTVPCVGSPTGACPCPCDYARDAGCGCRDLERGAALGLAFAKTPVYAAYPLTYLQSFNWRPTEQIIRPQSSKCRVGETGGGGGG